MKTCNKCQEDKDINCFYVDNSTRDKLNRKCIDCCKEDAKTSKRKEINRKYSKKPRVLERAKIYNKKYIESLEGRLKTLIKNSLVRAKKKKIPFGLDYQWVLQQWVQQDGCCSLTKIPFDLTIYDYYIHNPHSPSIDRIDTKLGYTKNNCRLILWCVNASINEWGEQILKEWINAYCKNVSC